MDDGYSIHPGVFEASEMSSALEAIVAATVARTKAGARHILGVPEVSRLAHDARMLMLAEQFIGPGPLPFRATLFDKNPAANWLVVWHQDTALPLEKRVDGREWGPWSTKDGVLYAHAPSWALEQVVALRISLDDSTASNGPLRVLPNTHARGVMDEGQISRLVGTITPVECAVSAGGVVGMRPLIVHGSSKATDDQPRRVLHIEYSRSRTLGPGIELAIARQAEGESRHDTYSRH